MRRHIRFVGGLVLLAAATAVNAGCSDGPGANNPGAAGSGGGAGGSSGGAGGGAGTGGASATGGTGGAAGGGGSLVTGGSGGSGGASATGGTGGGGGATGGGGGATGGSGGATAGTGGRGGAGGTGGAVGTGGTGGTSSTGAAGTGGAVGTGGAAGTGGTGVAGTGGGAGTLAAPAISGGAVINSDFVTTSVSLLNAQAGLVRADCVHSMTTGTGSKTISGDVSLPSQPQRGGQVVIIDRGNVALTFVNPATCAVDRQFSVKAGYNLANPHDLVIVSASKAYVTRYGRNAAPANPLAAGDDILILDPRDGTISGRIDLAAYASADFGASPDRAVIAAGKVVVTLNRWNSDFYTNGVSSLIIIDPATDQVVQHMTLGGLKNCEGLDYLDATRTVLVACGGQFGSSEQALESGVAVVNLSTTPATLTRVISAVAFPTPPVTFLWVAALPSASAATRAFTATLGSFSPSAPDRLYQFDFVTGVTMSFGSTSPFDLGRPVAGNGRLLVPDASAATPRIHVYDARAAGAPTLEVSFVADTVNGLPPREVAWY